MAKKLEESEIKKILNYHDKGFSCRETANKTDYHLRTVLKYVKQRRKKLNYPAKKPHDVETHMGILFMYFDDKYTTAQMVDKFKKRGIDIHPSAIRNFLKRLDERFSPIPFDIVLRFLISNSFEIKNLIVGPKFK